MTICAQLCANIGSHVYGVATVSFAEYSLFHRALLQKRPIILRSLLINVAPTLARTSMGWLRLVSFLKLYVSFAKEPYERDDILQKRPVI